MPNIAHWATANATRKDLLLRLLILVVVIAAFSIVIKGFISVNNLYSILQVATPIGLAAVGVGVTMLAGEFDLSVGSMTVLGGVIAVSMAPLGPGAAVAAAVAVGIGLGATQGFLIALLRVSSLVVTIGTLILFRGFAYLLAGDASVSLTSFEFGKWLNTRVLMFSPFSFLLIALVVGVWWALNYSKIGHEIMAIGGGRREAVAGGIKPQRPVTIAFAFSGGMAALGGALVSLSIGGATPTGFSETLLTAVAAAVIGGIALSGGKGSPWGILIGAIALGVISSGVSVLGAPTYISQLLSGGLLLVALLSEMVSRGQIPLGFLRKAIRRRQPAVAA
ncbi:ABC transporter permease [Arthrobacter sp. NPDC056691]|uniref:ABC transporter permease n=1 Tax=Arthrobacter sp. NPDC056691 TaxID=3345913 RepID=UPI00366C0055